MSEEHKERNIVTAMLAGVGLGALVGSVVALLFAPQSGTETREDIKAAAEKLKDKAEELSKTISETAQTAYDKSRDVVENASSKMGDAIDNARKAAEEKKQELISQLEEEDEG
jgi:gas vesicle protein